MKGTEYDCNMTSEEWLQNLDGPRHYRPGRKGFPIAGSAACTRYDVHFSEMFTFTPTLAAGPRLSNDYKTSVLSALAGSAQTLAGLYFLLCTGPSSNDRVDFHWGGQVCEHRSLRDLALC